MSTTSAQHTWKFYRLGGLDQVAFETKEDLLHLEELDQKLWVALSCPVKGLEIDEKTLAMIDADGDGRIRVPELIAAVKWTAARLRDVSLVLKPGEELPVSEIDDSSAEGKAIHASVRQVLIALGKPQAGSVTLADVGDTKRIFASSAFNGDGVITPDSTTDAALSQVIKDIIATQGGVADKGGEIGTVAERIDTFFADLAAFSVWSAQGATESVLVLGDRTAAASAAVQAVRAKVDDFFTRSRLAAYDPRSVAVLNRTEAEYASLAAKDLSASASESAAFPLSRIDGSGVLSLVAGVNPAWSSAVSALRATAVAPVYGETKDTLTETEWRSLAARFDAFLAWQSGKAGASVEGLGAARVAELLASKAPAALAELVVADKAVAAEFDGVVAVERLLRYRRDLRTLLYNFVNFFDFYSKDRYAVFQAGTLFLDSRSTELCIRVDGPNSLAAMSKAYIAYCTCTRPGGQSINIAACFTQGDSDFLFAGRHGVFYDRQGRDWDAVITSMVDNPISIPQAFWSPYKKFLRMIEEQIAKRAASAEAENHASLAKTAEGAANVDKAKAPPAAPKKFDLALITGIGVAIGSIGGFLAAVFAKILELKVWQYPLLLVALMLAISLPSMVIAWIKLRQRNLGPILEGNGWAVNGRVMINIPFGTALTEKAVLPLSAKRMLTDPYADESARKARNVSTLVTVLLVVAYAAVAYLWGFWPFKHGYLDKPAITVTESPATPPPAPAK